jgi:S-adenosylmethionine:tRNA ribosyltransferase-isomerase
LIRTDDFDYHLPESLIAQQPVEPRDACRLLILPRQQGSCSHTLFSNLIRFLQPGDRLVFNNTRVIPARIFCRKATGGKCEVFFLERTGHGMWKALVKPGRYAQVGTQLYVEGSDDAVLMVTGILHEGERLIRVDQSSGQEVTIEKIMEGYGHMPLPHYIEREDVAADRETYQTVYASVSGAVAAPTAGLHFTDSMLQEIKNMGIGITHITLHVGIGTFRPVQVEHPEDHVMHEERYIITSDAAEEIEATRRQGGRIIAVGTTVVRVLEHCFAESGKVVACEGTTGIMILPPYTFGSVDGVITNFHLPRSTLLMLVSAFCGRERTLAAYREAVEKSYRFYSYGDAMFIS